MSQESNSSYDRPVDLRARWEADAREEALSYDEEVSRWGVADRWDEPEDYSWFYDGDEDEGPADYWDEDEDEGPAPEAAPEGDTPF